MNYPVFELFKNWSKKHQPRPQLPPHPENQENPEDQLPVYPIREPHITVLPHEPGSEKFYQPHFDIRQIKNQLIDLDRLFPALGSPDTTGISDSNGNNLTDSERDDADPDSSTSSDQDQEKLTAEAANVKIKELETWAYNLQKKNKALQAEYKEWMQEKKLQNMELCKANIEIDKWQSICRERQRQINSIYEHREVGFN